MSDWIKNNKIVIGVIIGVMVIATSLFVYLFWYDSSDKVTERVRVIANIGEGCIAETHDGFILNIGPCYAFPGEVIIVTYDVNSKKQAMNSTK